MEGMEYYMCNATQLQDVNNALQVRLQEKDKQLRKLEAQHEALTSKYNVAAGRADLLADASAKIMRLELEISHLRSRPALAPSSTHYHIYDSRQITQGIKAYEAKVEQLRWVHMAGLHQSPDALHLREHVRTWTAELEKARQALNELASTASFQNYLNGDISRSLTPESEDLPEECFSRSAPVSYSGIHPDPLARYPDSVLEVSREEDGELSEEPETCAAEQVSVKEEAAAVEETSVQAETTQPSTSSDLPSVPPEEPRCNGYAESSSTYHVGDNAKGLESACDDLGNDVSGAMRDHLKAEGEELPKGDSLGIEASLEYMANARPSGAVDISGIQTQQTSPLSHPVVQSIEEDDEDTIHLDLTNTTSPLLDNPLFERNPVFVLLSGAGPAGSNIMSSYMRMPMGSDGGETDWKSGAKMDSAIMGKVPDFEDDQFCDLESAAVQPGAGLNVSSNAFPDHTDEGTQIGSATLPNGVPAFKNGNLINLESPAPSPAAGVARRTQEEIAEALSNEVNSAAAEASPSTPTGKSTTLSPRGPTQEDSWGEFVSSEEPQTSENDLLEIPTTSTTTPPRPEKQTPYVSPPVTPSIPPVRAFVTPKAGLKVASSAPGSPGYSPRHGNMSPVRLPPGFEKAHEEQSSVVPVEPAISDSGSPSKHLRVEVMGMDGESGGAFDPETSNAVTKALYEPLQEELSETLLKRGPSGEAASYAFGDHNDYLPFEYHRDASLTSWMGQGINISDILFPRSEDGSSQFSTSFSTPPKSRFSTNGTMVFQDSDFELPELLRTSSSFLQNNPLVALSSPRGPGLDSGGVPGSSLSSSLSDDQEGGVDQTESAENEPDELIIVRLFGPQEPEEVMMASSPSAYARYMQPASLDDEFTMPSSPGSYARFIMAHSHTMPSSRPKTALEAKSLSVSSRGGANHPWTPALSQSGFGVPDEPLEIRVSIELGTEPQAGVIEAGGLHPQDPNSAAPLSLPKTKEAMAGAEGKDIAQSALRFNIGLLPASQKSEEEEDCSTPSFGKSMSEGRHRSSPERDNPLRNGVTSLPVKPFSDNSASSHTNLHFGGSLQPAVSVLSGGDDKQEGDRMLRSSMSVNDQETLSSPFGGSTTLDATQSSSTPVQWAEDYATSPFYCPEGMMLVVESAEKQAPERPPEAGLEVRTAMEDMKRELMEKNTVIAGLRGELRKFAKAKAQLEQKLQVAVSVPVKPMRRASDMGEGLYERLYGHSAPPLNLTQPLESAVQVDDGSAVEGFVDDLRSELDPEQSLKSRSSLERREMLALIRGTTHSAPVSTLIQPLKLEVACDSVGSNSQPPSSAVTLPQESGGQWQAERDALLKKVLELEEHVHDLEGQHARLAVAGAVAGAAAAMVAAARDAAAGADSNVDGLLTADEKVQELEEMLTEAQVELEDLVRSHVSAQKWVTAASGSTKDLMQVFRGTAQQLLAVESEVEGLQTQLLDVNVQMMAAEGRLMEAIEQLENAQAALGAVNVGSQGRELPEQSVEKSPAAGINEALEAPPSSDPDKVMLEEQLKDANNEVIRLGADLAAISDRHSQLQSELQKAQAETETLRDHLAAAQRECGDLTRALEAKASEPGTGDARAGGAELQQPVQPASPSEEGTRVLSRLAETRAAEVEEWWRDAQKTLLEQDEVIREAWARVAALESEVAKVTTELSNKCFELEMAHAATSRLNHQVRLLEVRLEGESGTNSAIMQQVRDRDEELKSRARMIEKTNGLVQELEQKVTSLENQAWEYETQAARYEQARMALEQKVNCLQGQTEEQAAEMNRCMLVKDQLQAALGEKEHECERLESSLAQAEAERVDAKKACAELQEHAGKLESSLAEREARLGELEGLVSSLEFQRDLASGECEAVSVRLKATEAECKALEAAVEKAEERNTKLAQLLASVQGELEELEAQHKELKLKKDEECRELLARMMEADEKLANLKFRCDTLEGQLKQSELESHLFQTRGDELDREVTQLASTKAELEWELLTMEEKNARLEEVHTALKARSLQQQEELQGLREKLQDAQAKVEELRGSCDEVQREREVLAKRVAEMEEERAGLGAKVQGLEAKKEELDVIIAGMQVDLRVRSDDASMMGLRVTSLQAQIRDLSDRILTAEVDRDASQARVAALDQTVLGLRVELDKSHGKLEEADQQLEEADQQLEQLRRKLEELQAEADGKVAAHEQAKGLAGDLSSELFSAQSALNEVIGQRDQSVQALERLQTEASQTRKELEEKAATLAAAVEKVQNLEVAVQRAQAAQKALEDERNELRKLFVEAAAKGKEASQLRQQHEAQKAVEVHLRSALSLSTQRAELAEHKAGRSEAEVARRADAERRAAHLAKVEAEAQVAMLRSSLARKAAELAECENTVERLRRELKESKARPQVLGGSQFSVRGSPSTPGEAHNTWTPRSLPIQPFEHNTSYTSSPNPQYYPGNSPQSQDAAADLRTMMNQDPDARAEVTRKMHATSTAARGASRHNGVTPEQQAEKEASMSRIKETLRDIEKQLDENRRSQDASGKVDTPRK